MLIVAACASDMSMKFKMEHRSLVQGEAGALGRQRMVGAGLMGCGVELLVSVGSSNVKPTTLYLYVRDRIMVFNLDLEFSGLSPCTSSLMLHEPLKEQSWLLMSELDTASYVHTMAHVYLDYV